MWKTSDCNSLAHQIISPKDMHETYLLLKCKKKKYIPSNTYQDQVLHRIYVLQPYNIYLDNPNNKVFHSFIHSTWTTITQHTLAAILDRNVGGVWYIVSTISAHSLTGLRVEIVQSLSSPFFPPPIFLVFTSHVIKTKNRNHSKNKVKNLGYDR